MATETRADGAPVPGQPQTRYDDLLDAATRLFGEHGYERTTVRMIAEEMGVQSGSLYSHIRSKEDVLASIVLACAEGVLDAVRAALAAASDDAEAQLRAVCRAHLRVLHDRQAAVTVYFDEWQKLEPESRARVVALRREYEQMLAGVIQGGIDKGVFATSNLRAIVLVLLSSLNWAYKWYSPDGPLAPEQIADSFVDVTLAGLWPRDAAAPKSARARRAS